MIVWKSSSKLILLFFKLSSKCLIWVLGVTRTWVRTARRRMRASISSRGRRSRWFPILTKLGSLSARTAGPNCLQQSTCGKLHWPLVWSRDASSTRRSSRNVSPTASSTNPSKTSTRCSSRQTSQGARFASAKAKKRDLKPQKWTCSSCKDEGPKLWI